ncbi:hypothetical protein BGZ51_000624 [Haplosporangium sp. Z 767]|nr:hypothetical protein BGZ51_000624 [Haplosporangium sp. Z 767]KAF9192986.1 hypothetical protein BGZ50_007980 [Haplosporangium sp. Z 11]
MTSLKLEHRTLPAEDVPLAYKIEIEEYPEDEAATLKSLTFRQANAPELFQGCYIDGTLVGYVVSTLASGNHLTHDSMSVHEPQGNAVCIHSVCVAKAYQRRGIARAMLKEYLARVKRLNHASSSSGTGRQDRVLLIAHKELTGLYSGAGFEMVGLSEVVHGPDAWYEMVHHL